MAHIVGAGGEAAAAGVDVTRRGDLPDLVELACQRFGKIEQRAEVDVDDIIVRPTAQS
jgi:hypothetical protein